MRPIQLKRCPVKVQRAGVMRVGGDCGELCERWPGNRYPVTVSVTGLRVHLALTQSEPQSLQISRA
jgi:hypothetical protein